MVSRQLRVTASTGVALSFLNRFLSFDGELVETHPFPSGALAGWYRRRDAELAAPE